MIGHHFSPHFISTSLLKIQFHGEKLISRTARMEQKKTALFPVCNEEVVKIHSLWLTTY